MKFLGRNIAESHAPTLPPSEWEATAFAIEGAALSTVKEAVNDLRYAAALHTLVSGEARAQADDLITKADLHGNEADVSARIATILEGFLADEGLYEEEN